MDAVLGCVVEISAHGSAPNTSHVASGDGSIVAIRGVLGTLGSSLRRVPGSNYRGWRGNLHVRPECAPAVCNYCNYLPPSLVHRGGSGPSAENLQGSLRQKDRAFCGEVVQWRIPPLTSCWIVVALVSEALEQPAPGPSPSVLGAERMLYHPRDASKRFCALRDHRVWPVS